ncbi:WD repeat-containing protein 62 isoform X2 [Cynoglossus semilaevis]|uniref:WD repeat-containing protein 62 isoform X2 n=1 Tax=Cynoglossus semilaevis TaxID=244447 RepID=UPI000D631017|nr:mitogen-activated protein kinase-binding protein 1-like isoform X2 [Cynoglossus semilaevis]
MAELADIGLFAAVKKKTAAGRRSRQSQQKRSSSGRVSLEKVLGISTSSSSGLTSDPNSGLIAYPAGCVIVLLQPKTNNQTHIINTSRKPFSALAFSHDGKYLVTGESGHKPCVRVWEVGGAQVSEVQSHKYGVSCVAFSTNSSYIVSVGYQHDMTVSVWDWRKGSIIASNKVSSRVFAVSFSQDNSYFVTAGNRHVKFWYLDASKERRVNSTVPLIGRSGLLGDHKNSIFTGVACGCGLMASSTYCITSSGLLCLFNSRRQLESWVDLKTSSASCLAVSDNFIFCGCADGVIRVFSPSNLQYIATLQRPHRLGVDLSQTVPQGLLPASPGAHYPDTLALTFDPAANLLTCVYNDHSVYVWDVKEVRNAAKLYSALYHSSCVWSIEVYPELSDDSQACLPPSSFFTCSSDNTIRLWQTDVSGSAAAAAQKNLYSNDLLKILYVGENTQHLQNDGDKGELPGADGKPGVRVLGISPDGQHLAAGDRCGNLRIFALQFLDEIVKIEAHNSEVLCLEFSPASTGVKLLASASRDRLIHIFNLDKNYSLEQTLNDHSASVTAVKFTGESPEVTMVSCGADKSIYFQTAEQTAEGLSFSRRHHVVEKTTLYDMDLDSSRTHVAVACQDRSVRVYNVETGKLKKCLKGSSSDEGYLVKVQMDPSGSFLATSCSDKNISIFDYESGDCVATLFGHSEFVTCMRFSQDCRHLITVSGDSCVFVWRLDSQMTATMRKKQDLKLKVAPQICGQKELNIRRETFITVPSLQLLQREQHQEEQEELSTPCRLDSDHENPVLQTNGKLPMWLRKMGHAAAPVVVQTSDEHQQVRSKWAKQISPLNICSNCSPSPTQSHGEVEEEGEEEEGDEAEFHPQSLESMLEEEEEEEEEAEVSKVKGEECRKSTSSPNNSSATDRELSDDVVTNSQHSLVQLEVKGQVVPPVWSSQLSPDSACSEGTAGSMDQQHAPDTDSLSQGSSVGSLGLEEDDDRNPLEIYFETLASSLGEEKFDTDLATLQPSEEKHFLNPRLSISARFLSRFQDRLRARPSRPLQIVSIPTRISEETLENTSVNVSPSSSGTSRGSARKEQSGVKNNRSIHLRRASCVISQQPPRQPTRRRRHTVVVVQCRDAVGDITSRNGVVSGVQQRSPLLETTPSPIVKMRKEDLKVSETLTSLDHSATCVKKSSSVDLSSQKSPSCASTKTLCKSMATPSRVVSLGGDSRWSPNSNEETPTNANQTISANLDPTPTPSSTKCHLMTSDNLTCPSDIPSCSVSRLDKGQDVESEKQLIVQQVADQLRETTRQAVHLYQQFTLSPEVAQQHMQMSTILKEAFDFVLCELQTVSHSPSRGPSDELGDRGSLSLLEKYSELLVQMTREKLNQF